MIKVSIYYPKISKNILLGYIILLLTNINPIYSQYKVADTVFVRQNINDYLYEYEYIYNTKSNISEIKTIISKDNKISSGFKSIFNRNSEDIVTSVLNYGLIEDKWYLFSKDIYSYDINNLLVEKITEIRKEGKWVQDKRYFYIYNDKKLRISEYYQKWENDGWVNNNRKSFTYDENDSLIVFLSENIVNNEWAYDFRFTKLFDSLGNLIEHTYEKWKNWQLVEYWKYSYSYNTDGTQESSIFEMLVKENKTPISKFNYIYDNKQNILQQTEYSWKDVEWVGKERINYKYDNQSLISSIVYEKIWNDNWTEYKRISKKYNAFNKISEILVESFGTEWYPKTKEVFEYDKNGNELAWVKQEIFNDIFTDKYKIKTNYDTDGYITEIVSLKQDFETWKWDSVNSYKPLYIKDSLQGHSFYGFYLKANYKTFNSKLPDEIKNFIISPNPATTSVRFQLDIPQAHAIIYDGKGSLIKNVDFNENLRQSIDISDLQPGIYFILIGNKTQKFIKQ